MLRPLSRPVLVAAAIGIGAALAGVAARADDNLLPATTSWIGNTFGFGHGTWTQIDITAIAVSTDGKVYTNSPWDESGAEASVYQDGRQLTFAGGTHGWGRTGGDAVAVNARYVFVASSVNNERGKLVSDGVWPPKGESWYGISRRAIGDVKKTVPFRAAARADVHGQLAASFLPVNRVQAGAKAPIYGLAASDSTVYAANTTRDEIAVIDADSMQQKSAWKVHEPGRIALAPDGTLWVLTDTRSAPGAHLVHYTADGKPLPDKVAIPEDADPVDIAIDKKGRLYVADNGWRQQVLIFTASRPGQYELTDTFGERYGIWGRQAERAGPSRPVALQRSDRRRRRRGRKHLRVHERGGPAIGFDRRGTRRVAAKLHGRREAALAGGWAALRRRRMHRPGPAQ